MSDERLAEAIERFGGQLDHSSIAGRTIVDAVDELAGAINRLADAIESGDNDDDE